MKGVLKNITTVLAAGGLSLLSACGPPAPTPVAPQDFYTRRSLTPSPIPALDQPGALTGLPDARTPPTPTPLPRNPGPIGPFDENDYQPLPQRPTTLPSARTTPTTIPSSALANPSTQQSYAENQYMTLGGVVAVVNGTPIYANKVLRLVTPILRQYAREMNIDDFEWNARDKIKEQIELLKNDELEVAAAEHSLDPKQIAIAKQLTIQWRTMQIAEAGGSEQVAVARAEQATPGEDFHDLENDQYRLYLWEVYKAFKVDPDIQFTAEEEREYYSSHLDKFSTPTKATIILIEADPARIGSDAKARDRLLEIHERVLAGEDFAAYARNQNDLPGASGPEGSGGLLKDVKPNTFVFTKVDAQIWKVPVGQISDVIADSGAYYMFKVISRENGQTRAFADAAVQEFIRRNLTALQLQQQREAEIEKLMEEGIVDTSDPEMIEVAVQMARQNYPIWSKEKPDAPKPEILNQNPESNPKPE